VPAFRGAFNEHRAPQLKTLNGPRPADLLGEQPTRVKLVINLKFKAATTLGLNMPPTLLSTVIE
jgi:hypothetical protein